MRMTMAKIQSVYHHNRPKLDILMIFKEFTTQKKFQKKKIFHSYFFPKISFEKGRFVPKAERNCVGSAPCEESSDPVAAKHLENIGNRPLTFEDGKGLEIAL